MIVLKYILTISRRAKIRMTFGIIKNNEAIWFHSGLKVLFKVILHDHTLNHDEVNYVKVGQHRMKMNLFRLIKKKKVCLNFLLLHVKKKSTDTSILNSTQTFCEVVFF